jgi:excisionase family DNA binding protein
MTIDELTLNPRLLSTTEAMAVLRKTRATVCRWVRDGKILAIRLPDNSYLFDSVQLAGWMRGRLTAKPIV